MLQHLALFHGEALPVHALSLLQNAFECNYELISESVRWPLARVLALSRANQLRIMQVIVITIAFDFVTIVVISCFAGENDIFTASYYADCGRHHLPRLPPAAQRARLLQCHMRRLPPHAGGGAEFTFDSCSSVFCGSVLVQGSCSVFSS